MEKNLHQLIGSSPHYLQGFILVRWCRISAANCMDTAISPATEYAKPVSENPTDSRGPSYTHLPTSNQMALVFLMRKKDALEKKTPKHLLDLLIRIPNSLGVFLNV